MKRLHSPRIALLSAALFCGVAAHAQQAPMTPAPPAPQSAMSSQEYSAALDRINADDQAARALRSGTEPAAARNAAAYRRLTIDGSTACTRLRRRGLPCLPRARPDVVRRADRPPRLLRGSV
ncbi:MAG TPA: hypothetical protein PKB14_04540 [Rubrivivax sp.]|nr:hypothetical protein [Rubrivivax sp.]